MRRDVPTCLFTEIFIAILGISEIGTRIVGAEGKIHDHQPYNVHKFIIGLLARLKNFILRKNLLILLHKLLISFGLSGYWGLKWAN